MKKCSLFFKIATLILLFCPLSSEVLHAQTRPCDIITTIPGGTPYYQVDGLVFDRSGNILAVYDSNIVVKITPGGSVTTIAGTGVAGDSGDGGPATAAQINDAESLAFDSSGNLYLAESDGCRVRKIDTHGIISTYAGNGTVADSGDGGQATAAGIGYAQSITFDREGNLYVSQLYRDLVRKVTPAGIISTFAGMRIGGTVSDGVPATAALLEAPEGVWYDNYSNSVLVVNNRDGLIRAVNDSGIIRTVASVGRAFSVVTDRNGTLYIASDINKIFKKRVSGVVEEFAGTGAAGYSGDGGEAIFAGLNEPRGLTIGPDSNIYFADFGNNRIRKIVHETSSMGPILGPTTVCRGAVITLSDTTSGGYWTVTDPSLALTDAYGHITGWSVGSTTVSYIAGFTGCNLATAPLTVNDTPLIGYMSGPDFLCFGDTTRFFADSPGGVWSVTPRAIATIDASGLVTGLDSGYATVTYTISNVCGSTYLTYPIWITDYLCNTRVASIVNHEQPFLYPNPVQDIIHISSNQPVTASVFSIEGKSLIHVKNVTDIDVSKLLPGVYFVLLINDDGAVVHSERVVKE